MPENLLKRPHFGKEHIAESAAELAVRAGVLSPEKPVDQLIGFHGKCFHCQKVCGSDFGIAGSFFSQRDILHLAPVDIVGEAITAKTKVILDLGSEIHLFQGRYLLVSSWAGDTNFGWFVRVHRNLYAGGKLIVAVGRIGEFKLPDLIVSECEGQ